MNRHDRLIRGESAQHLLNNPTALAALDAIEHDCYAAWAGSQPDDTAGRELAYNIYLAVKLFRGKLGSWSDDAKIEVSNSEARTREAAALN
jgi:hypothetical protein